MKILYGVQGTGNGHTSRARAMSHALREQGVELQFFFSGRDKDKYFSMESFGNYETRRGITFVTEQGKVNYPKTLLCNNFPEFVQDIRQLDLAEYDLVISDFEPISAWAARKQHKACISLSHQNAFRYPVPLKGASWFDKQLIDKFVPANYHLGLHWYHFGCPVLPPIIHEYAYRMQTESYILVYLPFENLQEVTALLGRFNQFQFLCYHPEVMEKGFLDNIELHPLSHENFQYHLGQCAGVIANGGFELPSEAISLGKKLLLKPLKGQFEQQSNVATLEMLGLATAMESFDIALVRQWLEEPLAEPVIYPDVSRAISKWIVSGEWHDQQELCQSLWQQVDFPEYISL